MITIEGQNENVFGDFESIFREGKTIYSYINAFKNRVVLGQYETEDRTKEVYRDIKLAAVDGSTYDIMDGKVRRLKYKIFKMPHN